MGDMVAEFDWAETPLGPIESWPESLTTTVGIMLHSKQPMFLWWGPELIQIYNDAYVPSFGVGKHPRALGQRGRECWVEIWPIIGPQIDDVLTQGKACWFEDALVPIFRNGKIEDVYWTYGYSPVFDEAGTIAGVMVICSETTARVQANANKEATRVLVEQERERLLRFFSQAPTGICLLRGPDFVFEFANHQYERLVGRRDLVGKALLDALPELRGKGFDDLLRRVVETQEPYYGHEVFVQLAREADEGRETLEDVYCTFIYSPMRTIDGTVDGVSVFALDVTGLVVARKEVEQLAAKVQKSEGELRALAESMPQLAWSAGPDGVIDWYNRRWYDYTGKDPASAEEWNWHQVHDPEVLPEVTRRWQQAITTGDDFEMEIPLRRSDGVFRWHLARAVALKDETGAVTRWFGTNTDVDDFKRLEAESARLLEAAQRDRRAAEAASLAKDEFLTTASHELRTPLNAILGWARLLRAGQLDPSAYLRGIESIERNAAAQVRLVEDILDGARVITGKLRLEIRPLDLTQLVRAALDAVRPAAEAKSITLSTELDPLATRISGDPERLQQVIWNLCNNAIKFTPKGGSVTVRLKRDGTDVELTVKDTGLGIAPEFLPHVFERFRQGEGSTTRRFGGLGLGLALVRHFVEAHGGSVSAESDGTGEGATFRVRVPMQAVLQPTSPSDRPSPDRSFAVSPQNSDLSGIRVLVVDDETDARDLVATVLRGRGADVRLAGDADEALTELGKEMPDVLLSDVGMPKVSGYDLIKRIRSEFGAEGAELPAIALTAYAREEDRRLAVEAGFHDHIPKPVEPADMIRIVATSARARPNPSRAAPEAGPRADILFKASQILQVGGVSEFLKFINSRTAHRYTAICRFKGSVLEGLHLYDAETLSLRDGATMHLPDTYCSIVGETDRSFTTADTRRDERLRKHGARDAVVSYCGVPIRATTGEPLGTLCHFDLIPCDVPTVEIPLMEATARLLTPYL